jgi:hypothetical protein
MEDTMITPTTMKFLTTFRRIPDDVMLSIASREFDMNNGTTCICGWALREAIGEATGVSAEDVALSFFDVPYSLCKNYGGTFEEWTDLYTGVTNYNINSIELAFVLRLDEIPVNT